MSRKEDVTHILVFGVSMNPNILKLLAKKLHTEGSTHDAHVLTIVNHIQSYSIE